MLKFCSLLLLIFSTGLSQLTCDSKYYFIKRLINTLTGYLMQVLTKCQNIIPTIC